MPTFIFIVILVGLKPQRLTVVQSLLRLFWFKSNNPPKKPNECPNHCLPESKNRFYHIMDTIKFIELNAEALSQSNCQNSNQFYSRSQCQRCKSNFITEPAVQKVWKLTSCYATGALCGNGESKVSICKNCWELFITNFAGELRTSIPIISLLLAVCNVRYTKPKTYITILVCQAINIDVEKE